MRTLTILIVLTGLLFTPTGVMPNSLPEPQKVSFRVTGELAARDVPRIGVNLGSQTSWGAEQLMANVLANPGFEPTIDGAIVVVKETTGADFTDDTSWLRRPDHFWAQARFSVRTGKLAGREGMIVDSDSQQGLPHFRAEHNLIGLAEGDVIALSQTQAGKLPSQWWWEHESRNRIRIDTDHRSGSQGMQSLLLAPDSTEPVAAVSYLDMIGVRAGKLLPLNGSWELRFWARSNGHAELTVQLRRLSRPAMLRQILSPSAQWREYRFRFEPGDFGPPANLEFRLEANGAGGRIWVDDVSLSPSDSPASGFRREVVETLRQLRPGYLRDWQGQQGDSFANRIADEQARRPSRSRPGDETHFFFSLPEFFALCHETDAQPWVVLPTTMRDEEWREAGLYLRDAANRYQFREIVVEFGNENWNALFRPAGIMRAKQMGEAAQRGFQLLKAASGGDRRILPALGGQFVNPHALEQSISAAPAAKVLAVAPYYALSIPPAAHPEDNIPLLFPDDRKLMQQWNEMSAKGAKQIALYEVNAHSTAGDASPESVSSLVTGKAAGSALLYRVLTAVEYGARRQCLYSLAGFDTFRRDGKLVRLFGITRDLASIGRLRPTGLAAQLANEAIGGDAYKVTVVEGNTGAESKPNIELAAFLQEGHWGLVAASASASELDVSIELPASIGNLPNTLVEMEGTSLLSSNETGNSVRLHRQPLHSEERSVHFHLAPYGAAAAIFEDVSNGNSVR